MPMFFRDMEYTSCSALFQEVIDFIICLSLYISFGCVGDSRNSCSICLCSGNVEIWEISSNIANVFYFIEI